MVAFAAIPASGRPWARIVSCNPCEVKDELIPPVFSGYPTDDTSDWSAFWSEYDRVLGSADRRVRRVAPRARRAAAPGRARLHVRVAVPQPVPVPGGDGLPRASALSPTWHRLDSSVRTDAPFDVDAALPGAAPLVYLSLGSLGSADVELMQRLIDVLARDRLPRDRQQGAAARTADARRQHVRRGVPAAAVDPAAGRRGHHARRQQHRDRVLPLRQADDRAAAVLGPIRQRATRGRAGLRRAAGHVPRSTTSS